MISTGHSIPYILKPKVPFPLDGIDSSEFVYGGAFFQLREDYTGAVIRIRRGSDNAELDVSATLRLGDGQVIVDPATISGFGSDCYLVNIYDQVGTGIDWSQSTSGTQLILCQSGTVVTNDKGIVGGLNDRAVKNCISDNYNYPKDLLEMSGYSNFGSSLAGRAGTRTLATQNGLYNLGYDNFLNEILARAQSSSGGTLATPVYADVSDPTNGVHSSFYLDDTNGVGFIRTQDGDSLDYNWTANSRTSATTNKVYFNQPFALKGDSVQHYSIMFNNSGDKGVYEQRIMRLMGMI